MLTTDKGSTGHFAVLWNGAPTRYEIVNGSLGLSGRDSRNVYGIINYKSGETKWIGSLASCKKLVTYWLGKAAGPGPV